MEEDTVGFDEVIYQCVNCGAYASEAESIQHHKTCKKSDREEFYNKLNEEVLP